MRAAARAMNDILERNAALQGLPEVRLRSTWQVVGHPRSTPWTPYGFHLVLWAHPRQVWGPGDCDVIPQADRVDPRAAVVVQANSVRSTLTQQNSAVRDEQIEAFVEPEQIGKVGRYPVYRGQIDRADLRRPRALGAGHHRGVSRLRGASPYQGGGRD